MTGISRPNYYKKTVLIFLFLISCRGNENKGAGIRIEKVSINYFENPFGIDDQTPRISWVMVSEGKNKKQSAYQIKDENLERKLLSYKITEKLQRQ